MATAKPENIEYVSRLKFASRFQYVADDHSREDVCSTNYFHVLSSRYLNPGDEVQVVVKGKQKDEWHKALFEVVSVSPKTTEVEQLTQWRSRGASVGKVRVSKAA
jgi:hypothetical protein